jgi:hypothetical protein
MISFITPRRLLPLLCLSLLACPTVIEEDYEVLAQQLDGVWVFHYSEAPKVQMQALHSGEVLVVDGCLEINGLAVIWYEEQLDAVEEALQLVDEGETVTLSFGGGGTSLDEGGSVDEFPDAILEHCDPRGVWWASEEEVEFL